MLELQKGGGDDMRSHRRNKAFTLMELLIVVAIIAVLVAIAIPVFGGKLDKAQEAACQANRRSLYAQVVVEHMLSNRPYSELFDEFVGSAGKCPCGGAFSWEDSGDTGIVHCDYHDDGASGSSPGSSPASSPALHGTSGLSAGNFQRGSVIQDETGTCVIMSGMWATWTAYSGGTKAAALAAQYGPDAILVNASDVKDPSFTGTLQVGDLYYDPDSDTYYYVNLVSQYESWPNSSWVPLLQ